MRRLFLAALLLTVAARPARAWAPPGLDRDAAAWMAGKRGIQDAVDHHRAAGLPEARALFDSLALAMPRSAGPPYWGALASYRLAELGIEGSAAAAAREASEGITRCNRALAIEAGSAEALALRGALRDVLARSRGDSTGLSQPGGQSLEDIDRALSLAPRCPRAWLLLGIVTARRRGPGLGAAEAAGKAAGSLAKASEMYAAEARPDSTAPDWGWDESLLWSARGAMLLGDHRKAYHLINQALLINPHNEWARATFLPAARDSMRPRPRF